MPLVLPDNKNLLLVKWFCWLFKENVYLCGQKTTIIYILYSQTTKVAV